MLEIFGLLEQRKLSYGANRNTIVQRGKHRNDKGCIQTSCQRLQSPYLLKVAYGSLQLFFTFSQFGKLQNSRTKICLSNQHS